MMKKKILIISYLFPPAGGGGVIRIKDIVKRLKNRFDITIITAKKDMYSNIYEEPLIEGIKIFRFSSYLKDIIVKEKNAVFSEKKNKKGFLFHIKRWIRYGLVFPDEYVLWVLKVFNSFNGFLENQKYDFIFTTSPPYSNLLLSALIAYRKNIPLIVEYRDIWHNNSVYPVLFPCSLIKKVFEKWILKKSEYIVFTTDKQKEAMIKMYPFIENKSVVIYNGYDNDLINKDSRYSYYMNGKRDYMKIVYLGSLTPYRNPLPFFEAVQEIMDEGDVRLQIEFVGYFDAVHKEYIDKYGLKEIVKIYPSVSHTKVVEKLKDGDAFLLIQSIKEGGDTAIPGKMFEYMATGKPIIIIDDGGAVKEFAEKYGYDVCGFDKNCIKKKIKDIYYNYKIKNAENVYTREYVANQMEKLWEKL